MLKFQHVLNKKTGEVWVASDMKELICNCNDETDIFLSYIDTNDKEVIIDEPLENLMFEGIKHPDHIGTWYSIDCLYNSEDGFMLLCEHETYGDETGCIIINLDGELILNDVWNGFDDYSDMIDAQELEKTYSKGNEKRMKIFYDMETRTYITEEELHKEFLELQKEQSMEYNFPFECYIRSCTSKHGTLVEMKDTTKLNLKEKK